MIARWYYLDTPECQPLIPVFVRQDRASLPIGMHDKRTVHDEFLEAVAHVGSDLRGGLTVNAAALQVRNPLFLHFNAFPNPRRP